MTRKLLLAALALACVVSPAFAGDGTVVSLPWGEMIADALRSAEPVIVSVATGAVGVAVTRIFPFARLFLTDRVVEAALRKWLDYGINAVPSATKGGVYTVDVGSAVLATALQRAVDRAKLSKPGALILNMAGGEAEVANKLFRLLHLEPAAGINVLQSVLTDLRATRG